MAQSGQSFGTYVCTSCLRSLRATSQRQLRVFSTSSQRSKTIPQFTPTSSSELDALLSDWRAKVFTPNVLAQHHRDLIYKKSRHDILTNDPGVTVTLPNDEEIKLEPMDEWDKPNYRKSLHQVAKILGSSSDADAWANLTPFLEGLVDARYVLHNKFLERITRKANEQGKHGIIIQCARSAKKTGIRLSNRPITRELFIGCHERAANVDFEGETVQKQGHLANTIALMLEEPQHQPDLNTQLGETDMRREPIVLGVLLEFAAEEAIHLHGGIDTSGEVASFVRKLLALSEERESLGGSLFDVGGEALPEHVLEECAILYNAMEMAMKVDMKASLGKDQELKTNLALKRKSKELEQKIQEYEATVRERAKGKPRRALLMLEKVRSTQAKLN